jgi:Tfp pilus assembly protein PilE
MEQSEEYKQLIKTLGQMHATEILSALAASKTGYWSYQNFINESVIDRVESALLEFISELEKYNSNRLIDRSL